MTNMRQRLSFDGNPDSFVGAFSPLYSPGGRVFRSVIARSERAVYCWQSHELAPLLSNHTQGSFILTSLFHKVV